VANLHTFGSVLRPDFRPVERGREPLVEFQPNAPETLYETYFSLLNDLRQALAALIDLVMMDTICNPYVNASIEASKREIYAV
jgi:predicted nucleotidyltransferase